MANMPGTAFMPRVSDDALPQGVIDPVGMLALPLIGALLGKNYVNDFTMPGSAKNVLGYGK